MQAAVTDPGEPQKGGGVNLGEANRNVHENQTGTQKRSP